MRNVDHAVDVLRDMIGLPSLAFNDAGLFEIVFDGAVSIDVVRISEAEIELSAPIENLEDLMVRERLLAVLEANYHGRGTGSGRLALDPRDGTVIHCRRLDVTRLESHDLELELLDFLKVTIYWLGPGTDAILARQAPPQPEAADDGDAFTLFRL